LGLLQLLLRWLLRRCRLCVRVGLEKRMLEKCLKLNTLAWITLEKAFKHAVPVVAEL
jgi:hypothetical protein